MEDKHRVEDSQILRDGANLPVFFAMGITERAVWDIGESPLCLHE